MHMKKENKAEKRQTIERIYIPNVFNEVVRCGVASSSDSHSVLKQQY